MNERREEINMGEKDTDDRKYVLSVTKLERFNTSSITQLTTATSREELEYEDTYDPFQHRKLEHPNSDIGAMVHLLKGSLGTGILAMPNAFRNAGLVFGMVGTVLVGLLCTHCVYILVMSSHAVCQKRRIPSLDYAGTAKVAFEVGPKLFRGFNNFAKRFVNTALVTTYYSAACVYVVFISASVKQVGDYYVSYGGTLDIRVYMVIFLLPLAALSMIRNLKLLVPFSALANVCIVLSFVITLYYIFRDMPRLEDRALFGTVMQAPLFFSTVIFAMEGIGVVMPIENSMKKPQHFVGCPGILNISMGIVIALYSIIGFFGYVKYGEATEGSVTLNLPVEEIMAQSVKILIAVAITCTYGLQMFVPTHIVWQGLEPFFSDRWKNLAQHAYRIGIAVVTVCVAAAVPNLGPIISLVGAVCFSTLGLLCPAVIETMAFWNNGLGTCRWRLYKNIFIAILSVCALISGGYASVLEIVATYGDNAA